MVPWLVLKQRKVLRFVVGSVYAPRAGALTVGSPCFICDTGFAVLPDKVEPVSPKAAWQALVPHTACTIRRGRFSPKLCRPEISPELKWLVIEEWMTGNSCKLRMRRKRGMARLSSEWLVRLLGTIVVPVPRRLPIALTGCVLPTCRLKYRFWIAAQPCLVLQGHDGPFNGPGGVCRVSSTLDSSVCGAIGVPGERRGR